MKIPPHSNNALADLLQIAKDLRDPKGGCPWDLEQTHASLASNLIEEANELVEVIEQKDLENRTDDFKEELGDVLFQVVLHAQLASERHEFTFDDVARTIAQKLVRRHPHVYAAGDAKTSDAVLKTWEEIKKSERSEKTDAPSYIDGIPTALPALQRAARLGEKASRAGFDWPSSAEGRAMMREKISEETTELEEALTQNQERAQEELGDLLFALAQYARHLKLDPEAALRYACRKFDARFRYMESELREKLNRHEKIPLDEWEAKWQDAKKNSAPNSQDGIASP